MKKNKESYTDRQTERDEVQYKPEQRGRTLNTYSYLRTWSQARDGTQGSV